MMLALLPGACGSLVYRVLMPSLAPYLWSHWDNTVHYAPGVPVSAGPTVSFGATVRLGASFGSAGLDGAGDGFVIVVTFGVIVVLSPHAPMANAAPTRRT